jgi:LacI family repressor for deo operon, udp, cdd, tsx, nupC, and nupG
MDIAQQANVSVATVSRVLHDSNRVSVEKRQRILEIIKDLRYEYTPKSVKSLKKNVILVLCGNIIEELLDGIEDAAIEFGYEFLIVYTMGQKYNNSKFIKKLIKDKVIGGMITIAISADSSEELQKVSGQIPIVQCCDDIDLPHSCIVSSDDVSAAYEAVNHLISIGRTRIGFLGLDRMLHPFKYSYFRECGYRNALRDANIPIDEDLIKHGDYTTESITESARDFLALDQKPDALFCARDLLANIFINTLHQAGLRVPEDIAVVGFGGIESSEMCWPSLTTVAQSYYEIGTEAVNLLHELSNGKIMTGRKTFVPHKLEIRDSTVKIGQSGN